MVVAFNMIGTMTDDEWFEANLAPGAAAQRLGIAIPGLPDEEIQMRFTGRAGRVNLQQGFDFYQFVLQHLPPGGSGDIVDFGGGWGRILRFFLREYPADRLVLFDCLTSAIECARSLRPPFRVEHTRLMPPLPVEKGATDLFYAFSVFSHLNETACRSWLAYFAEQLAPGGKAILTTRGRQHTANIAAARRQKPLRSLVKRLLGRHDGNLLTEVPRTAAIERLYAEGRFQFYPGVGGRELTSDVYGEAWIPEGWFRDHYRDLGFRGYEFFPEFKTVDQCVAVLTK